MTSGSFFAALLITTALCGQAFAQRPAPSVSDTLHSPVVSTDRRVTFRIFAPEADSVKLSRGDIPAALCTEQMTRLGNGVWETTTASLQPGAYRYGFLVDQVPVVDPRNTSVSESNMNVWSMVYVPGSEVMDIRNVPHGAVTEVTYYSTSLQRFRRMHVYTPPGYESGTERYPVFYLLHGAWDTDDAWTTVGRAGFIIDNLIADKKAVPMVVVMPAGHTGPYTAATRANPPARNEFVDDLLTDVKPYAEKQYRILADREHRAIAGLSMGGMQTLDIAIPHVGDYAYIGVFSSGIFELGGRRMFSNPADGRSWEERNSTSLDDQRLKKGLRLFWFATGKEDLLLGISRSTVELFRKHGFDVVYKETAGAHTWLNWRNYLTEFAPQLFQLRTHEVGSLVYPAR